MFTLSILLCTATQCYSATIPNTFDSQAGCEAQAVLLKLEGLGMIDRGQVEPHTFDHQCVKWGRQL